MALERIQPQGLAKPGTYSHVIRAGNTVYIAGQTATDAQGNVVGRGDITASRCRCSRT
jgi:enamine deaminase RidA (YjgF/YER057c/UK114 family)